MKPVYSEVDMLKYYVQATERVRSNQRDSVEVSSTILQRKGGKTQRVNWFTAQLVASFVVFMRMGFENQ